MHEDTHINLKISKTGRDWRDYFFVILTTFSPFLLVYSSLLFLCMTGELLDFGCIGNTRIEMPA
jgi:hypothetical protein